MVPRPPDFVKFKSADLVNAWYLNQPMPGGLHREDVLLAIDEVVEWCDDSGPLESDEKAKANRPRKSSGRKPLSVDDERKYRETVREWERYRDSKTGQKKEFCKSKGIAPKKLNAMTAWVRKSSVTNQKRGAANK